MPDTRIIENGWWVCPTCSTRYAERVEGCVDCLRAEVERLTARAERLADGLREAAASLESIAARSHPGANFDTIYDVIPYARNRGAIARAALAEQPAPESKPAEPAGGK